VKPPSRQALPFVESGGVTYPSRDEYASIREPDEQEKAAKKDRKPFEYTRLQGRFGRYHHDE
jgi:hypothetical protein